MPEFYMIFAPKWPNFTNNRTKNIFPLFFGGGRGARARPPPHLLRLWAMYLFKGKSWPPTVQVATPLAPSHQILEPPLVPRMTDDTVRQAVRRGRRMGGSAVNFRVVYTSYSISTTLSSYSH